jgi:hypothetical protein
MGRQSPSVAELADDITDPSRIPKVIAAYIMHYRRFPDYLLCRLCINAYRVDPHRPKPKPFVGGQDNMTAQERDQQNNQRETDNVFS